MEEEVSVVMAVYNGESYLEQSINSILKQTYQHFEFIIVNDGSTDRTKEILDSITDPRVKVYHLDKNHGTSYARNFAINKAKNQWIVLQDDDDISLPSRIEEQMNYIKDHPDVISVCSMFQSIPRKTPVGKKPSESSAKKINSFFTRMQIKNKRFYCPWICYGSAIISRNAVLQVGGYDTRHKLGEDYDLFLRLLELGPIDMIPKALYQYRKDPYSTSRKNRAKTRISIIKIAIEHIKRMFEGQGKLPIFAILGSKLDCEKFIKTVYQDSGIQVELFLDNIDENKLNQAYDLFKQEKINSIIVMDNIKPAKPIIEKLIKKGMTLNENLFLLKKFRKKNR